MNKEIDLVSLPKKSFWKLSIPITAFCLFDAIYGIGYAMSIQNRHRGIL